MPLTALLAAPPTCPPRLLPAATVNQPNNGFPTYGGSWFGVVCVETTNPQSGLGASFLPLRVGGANLALSGSALAASARLTGTVPASVCDLKTATSIDVSFNNLTGSIPPIGAAQRPAVVLPASVGCDQLTTLNLKVHRPFAPGGSRRRVIYPAHHPPSAMHVLRRCVVQPSPSPALGDAMITGLI